MLLVTMAASPVTAGGGCGDAGGICRKVTGKTSGSAGGGVTRKHVTRLHRAAGTPALTATVRSSNDFGLKAS